MRSSLAHIRQSRIAPSAINAPPPGFVPPSFGVGLPSTSTAATSTQGSSSGHALTGTTTGTGAAQSAGSRGLQEERVERDAWKMIQESLKKLKELKEREQHPGM